MVRLGHADWGFPLRDLSEPQIRMASPVLLWAGSTSVYRYCLLRESFKKKIIFLLHKWCLDRVLRVIYENRTFVSGPWHCPALGVQCSSLEWWWDPSHLGGEPSSSQIWTCIYSYGFGERVLGGFPTITTFSNGMRNRLGRDQDLASNVDSKSCK